MRKLIQSPATALMASIPTFLVLTLNGTAYFHGMDSVIALSILTGVLAATASMFRR